MEKNKQSNRGRRGVDLVAALAGHKRQVVKAQEMTFDELCAAYLAAQYGGCDMQLRKWRDLFVNRSAWSITTDEIADALEALIGAGVRPSTANRNASQLGSVYKWAQTKRLAPARFVSPTKTLPRYEEPLRRVELSDAELTKIISATMSIKDRRFSALVRLLADTGGRKSEVLERTWADGDLNARTITVNHTKTGIPRVLKFSEDTAQFISRVWPESQRKPGQMLFESKRAIGAPINYKKHWLTITAAIGRPDLRLHDLRHHRAKMMIQSGAAVAAAAQALGHSSLILFRRYGHLENAQMHAAVEKSWERGNGR